MGRTTQPAPRRPLGAPLRVSPWVATALLLSAGLGVVLADESRPSWPEFAEPSASQPAAEGHVGAPIGGAFSPSEVIFPPQTLALRFFHDRHINDAGMACVDCHAGATDSVRATDRLLPAMEVCLECHAIDDGPDATPPAQCTTCHPSYVSDPPRLPEEDWWPDEENFREVLNWPELPVIPAPNLIFPHKAHVEAEIACAHCHGAMEEVALATRHDLPTMNLCLSCHTEASDTPSDACATCHISRPDGRLQTEFAQRAGEAPSAEVAARAAVREAAPAPPSPLLTPYDVGRVSLISMVNPPATSSAARLEGARVAVLMPAGRFRDDDHRLGFLERHRDTAASDEAYCATCHTDAFCLDCHNGVIKPATIHPPNYAQLHAIDAYNNDPECTSCHTTQDFCLSCHQQVGLSVTSARPEGALVAEFSYHPGGWMLADAGLDSEHAVAAQRNIAACASCHNEQECIRCHSTQANPTTGIDRAINPHPLGWLDRCASLYTRNETACLKCHLVGDPLLSLCR